MESKKINQLATELAPDLSDLTIIGDPTTGISKKITLSQMASLFTGTVEEYANFAAFPLVGVADTIYIALDTNILYRWNTGTSAYVELSPNIVSSLVFNDANGFDGTINLVGSVATLTITTALTTGSVGFIGASGALLQDNANFFWDDTNNRLGLGTNAPTTALDVFGSGIIGRINGTSTNNAFLGFASAGTNKWSIGNVQSDHRFRIFSEANSAELISVLQTGEVGIGIANPLTKFHIDGGASALIANLDANVSVAKTLSFRSDNSNRINLEVSGTESGSNAGADFFLRTYTDLGALIETPFTIVRSTGVTTIKSLILTNALSVANGGTGITSLTAGRIPFGNGTSAFNSSANLFWDNTNNRLGINQGTPLYSLDISGDLRTTTSAYFATTSGSVGIGSTTIYNGGGFGRVLSIYETSTVALSLVTSVKQFQVGISGTDNDFRIYDFTNLAYRFSLNGSNGNIGIGTITPFNIAGVNLTVNNTSSSAIQLGVNNVRTAQFYADSSEVRLYAVANFALKFGTNDTERGRFTNGGNLLIGTTTDNAAKLQVSGNATFTSSLSMGIPSKQAIRAVPNQDTAATNLKTIMPNVEFGGTFTAMTLHILSTDGGGINSSIFHCSRNGGTTWTSTLVSSNGAANTITLTFGGTTTEPTLTLSGTSFNLFSVVYSVILR